MGRSTGLDRRNLAKSKGKLIYPARKRQARKQEQLTKAVIEFLERDDNSQMMPGKGDFKSCDGVKIQVVLERLHAQPSFQVEEVGGAVQAGANR